jgi:pimeloyl-ACP methyl ester carboxylesterase
MSSWILLRGLMREQRHWGASPPSWRSALPAPPSSRPTCRATASATPCAARPAWRRWWNSAAPTCARAACRRYSLLALSLGGMVAVEWASRYPQEIARCVLINTSMRPYSRFHQRLRWQNYPASSS